MFGFINQRLSIGLRLAALGTIFLIFAGTSTVLKALDGMQAVHFSEKELRGVNYVHAAWDYMQQRKADGLKDAPALNAEFDTEKSYKALVAAKKSSEINKAATDLIMDISDSANIELDPHTDSFYAGVAYARELPSWASSLDKLFKLAKQPASERRNALLEATLDSYIVRRKRVYSDYDNVKQLDTSGRIMATLSAPLKTVKSADKALEAAIRANLAGQEIDADQVRADFETALRTLIQANGGLMQSEVKGHIDEASADVRNSILANLAFILPAVALILYVIFGLSKRFSALGEAMDRLNKGDKTVDIPYQDDTNETGRIAATLARMKQDILEREAAQAQREADRLAAEAAQKKAEAEAQHRSEHLVVSTFGDGLKALAHEDFSFRLTAEVPVAYQSLKEDFNHAITISENNRREREQAAIQREKDRVAAEAAQKEAEEVARRQSVELVVSSFGEGLSALAERDLTYRINRDLPEEYRVLQKDFNHALEQLQTAMNDIRARASDVSSNCGEISRSARDMAKRTEQQAAALEETAAAVNEVTATVAKSAEGANQASVTAETARKDAARGNQVVQNAVEAMRAIARSSGEITQIIGVIDEIAFQTNLLALNAGVEAARAGDAGRGFAVVASEVRALAQRSAEAAKQIKTLIKASETQVDVGVKLVGESGESLDKIVADIGMIGQLMVEIASSQKEQATAMGEIDSAVGQMDQTTQQNAAMAEQSNASSEALDGYARELSDVVNRFRLVSQQSHSADGIRAA